MHKQLRVIIRLPGHTARGIARSLDNHGSADRPDWYITFDHEEGSCATAGQAAYWKQGVDGGTVEFQGVP